MALRHIAVKKTYTPRDFLAQRYSVSIVSSAGLVLMLKDGAYTNALLRDEAEQYAKHVAAVTGFPIEVEPEE